MKYLDGQNKWVKEINLTVGDTVLIASSADVWGGEVDGKIAGWVNEMEKTVGKTGQVVSIRPFGIEVVCEKCEREPSVYDPTIVGWFYPFYVLIKMENA